MDIVFKGRHTNVQDRFRQHATVKLAKLGKLDHKAIRIDVEVSKEHNPRQYGRSERVELTITSRGPTIRAEAAADDRFSALDLALDKLESRLRRASDRRKARHASHGPAKTPAVAAATANGAAASSGQPSPAQPANGKAGSAAGTRARREQVPSQPPVEPASAAAADDVVPIEMEGDGPLVVRQKFHTAAPMTIDQALFQMELVGHDFYLFRDKETGRSSVVYRRCGYRYGVIRLVEEQVPEQSGHLVAS